MMVNLSSSYSPLRWQRGEGLEKTLNPYLIRGSFRQLDNTDGDTDHFLPGYIHPDGIIAEIFEFNVGEFHYQPGRYFQQAGGRGINDYLAVDRRRNIRAVSIRQVYLDRFGTDFRPRESQLYDHGKMRVPHGDVLGVYPIEAYT
jgi:hypothetical protein